MSTPGLSPENPRRLRLPTNPIPYALSLAVLALAAYWHGLDGQLIGDDHARITAMAEFLRQGYQQSVTTILPDRPVLVMTILLNYKLGGLAPWGYKALSLAFHVAVGWVFFALLLQLQRRVFASSRPFAPAVAAAVFLVHPLNSQALLSAIQRGVILAALCALASFLAFLAYLSSGKRHFSLLALLLFVVGILAKSFIVTLPFILLIYLHLVERNVRPHTLALAPFFVAMLIPAIPYALGVNLQATGGLHWHDYLSIQTRVVWIYLRLFLVPANLRFFYEIDTSPGVLANLTWLAIAGHLAILGAGLTWMRRKPLISFGIFAMYLAFLPESGIFAIDHVAFEHRTYFPMLFFLLTLFAVAPSWPLPAPRFPAVALAALAAFSAMTDYRIHEVATHEKWVLNTYRYQTPNRWNNIWILDDLYGVGLTARGLELSEGMLGRDPGYPPYLLYRRLYRYATDAPQQRRETIGMISQALLQPEPWLDHDVLVNRLLAFAINNTREVAASPLVYQKNLERLFRNQIPRFFQRPNSYTDLRRLHRQLLAELRDHFEAQLLAGAIDDADFVQYLNILGEWGLHEPRAVPQLDGQLERLASAFPARAALIDASRRYYRDLRAELQR